MIYGKCEYHGPKCFEDGHSDTTATVDCAGCDYLILQQCPQTPEAVVPLNDLLSAKWREDAEKELTMFITEHGWNSEAKMAATYVGQHMLNFIDGSWKRDK